ncbi:hypothetical protein WOLCODRAFT_151735 [Wolfiporia cocos MD-104 SS10]|uniref:Pentacotripeptide-repeat region of PRORP domain-containing protein n=1 Tax=Wolfiporia cocos (strain MD-104) TaxID=742152 RepID=A0A2H3JHM5_WOLCO|nr:hypothetical protein WOLCODRAFT_151735 [Wolfiporia cocos MD-104 SS10]
MLPKVANHLLLHTTRAVAAVQNQTGHTIRNVLQLQSSSGPGASSSNSGWNGTHGAGPGGAKYHSGSRYYTGYQGAGRAVTQAESVTSNDVAQGINDDTDDSKAQPPKSPGRRKSVSIGVHERSRERLEVLRAVRAHARSRPAFADKNPSEHTQSSLTLSSPGTALLLPKHSVQAIRYEATAAAENETASAYLDLVPPPSLVPPPPSSSADASLSSPALDKSEVSPEDQTFYDQVKDAVRRDDRAAVLRQVEALSTRKDAHAALYNNVLSALHTLRKPDETLQQILDIYNDMIARDILPNFRTYATLITALTQRDNEVHAAVQKIETRIRMRTALGAYNAEEANLEDKAQIDRLRLENNFRSAMTLFQTACSFKWGKISIDVYGDLLRSCAHHANVDAALHVFAHLERRPDLVPSPRIYQRLISVYASVGDIQGAREVFEDFKKASQDGRIEKITSETESGQRRFNNRGVRIAVWNAMIEAYIHVGQHSTALGILEQMLDTKAGEAFGIADVPPPASSTFHRIISAFCDVGDISTALSWFDRLLAQSTSPRHPYEPNPTPSRPDIATWLRMTEALALDGRVDDLNRIYSRLLETAEEDQLQLALFNRHMFLQANLRHLRTQSDFDDDTFMSYVDFMVHSIVGANYYDFALQDEATQSDIIGHTLTRLYLKRDRPVEAMRLATVVLNVLRHQVSRGKKLHGDELGAKFEIARTFAEDIMKQITSKQLELIVIQDLLQFCAVLVHLAIMPCQAIQHRCLQVYMAEPDVVLDIHQWDALLFVALGEPVSNRYRTVELLLTNMRKQGVAFSALSSVRRKRIAQGLLAGPELESAKQLLREHDQEAEELIAENAPGADAKPTYPPPAEPNNDVPGISPSTNVQINAAHSRYVDEHYPASTKVSVYAAYNRFTSGRRKGIYPQPFVLGHLIASLGRHGEVELMHDVYSSAQLVLAAMEFRKDQQSRGWVAVEDSMVIGFAHAGDSEAAHLHRTRILENGGVMSADAYGALIHLVKDTTDDSQVALNLFNEAREAGVVPNLYLYNTIISKLARARKADDALALFHEMRQQQIAPSSVTYGAVIAACCRVGDAESAENLFAEMTQQKNFKPRIPPYNTMMQLYTYTKPDRVRVLDFFNALVAARVTPTAHTYKLLMDAYGTIQPIVVPEVERIFEIVSSGASPLVSGTHWASLINCYGCVEKDLDRALSTFDSIASHPSTTKSGLPLPDAVVFEALINVFVTLRRPDLIPVYVDRLQSLGIHMTAYIANLIIKGYANAGDIEAARKVFENLADPPNGVAAPHNHAPHDNENSAAGQVPVNVPVYREPSTWEAMVRAELGHGHRDRAIELLDRAQERQFPPAVYNRIAGIMLDDSVSPWASPATQTYTPESPATESPATSSDA